MVRHGRRLRPRGLPPLHGYQPRWRRLRDRCGAVPPSRRAVAAPSWPPRRWLVLSPCRSTRSTRANKHAVVGLARSLGEVYAPDGIRIHALCPSFAYTNIIKGSEQTLLDMGFPIIEVADVVAAFQRILDSDSTGQCLVRRRGPQERALRVQTRARPAARLICLGVPGVSLGCVARGARRWIPPGARPKPPNDMADGS